MAGHTETGLRQEVQTGGRDSAGLDTPTAESGGNILPHTKSSTPRHRPRSGNIPSMQAKNSGPARRRVLQTAAVAAALPLVHIRSAGAAGKLSIGFWDHWVAATNTTLRGQVEAWGEKNKVEVKMDFITSVGNKLLLTGAAEALAKAGHDMMTFRDWEVQNHAEDLAPIDDVMRPMIAKHGAVNEVSSYLAQGNGVWHAVPTTCGSNYKGPCARISLMKQHAGMDPTEIFPTEPKLTEQAKAWTWDAHLKAAEACQKAGIPFAIGLGTTPDSVDTAGALFRAYGAELVDVKGDIKVDSDAMRQVLEHAQKLVQVLPDDAVSYDDASNNRALIAGKTALIWNPPSAWAVAKRDAPKIAEDCCS